MALGVCVRGFGISARQRIAVLSVAVVSVVATALGGCDRDAPALVVRAVATGVPSLAPFFDESQGLGRDAQVRPRSAHGGLQQGDTPGLYGGSAQPAICDVVRLEKFLTDPAQARKARAWAAALSLPRAEIPDYLDRLTPVLLRHDTLVQNHDYKKGKATPFNALLQAGIAILVDERGIPAVKCSCGNPLRPFEGDTTRTAVEFDGRNEEWKGYEKASVVAVRPASRKMERLALVDVQEPDRGIDRPVGTTGEDDTAFDTRERRAVPELSGTTFAQASRRLSDEGLAAGFDGGGLPPDDARVTASDPPAGTQLRFGEYVTLSVAGGNSGGSSTPPGPGPGESRPTPDPPASKPTSSGPPGSTPSAATPSASTPSASTRAPSSSAPGGTGATGGTNPTGGTGPTGGTTSSAPPPSELPPPSSVPPPPSSVTPPPESPSSAAPPSSVAPPPSTKGPTPGTPPPSGTSAPPTGTPGTSGTPPTASAPARSTSAQPSLRTR
ncbi:DUF6777 domain-containing protein [Streptomyces sp. M41]|uniref:DUF6777 domain-containing protein n=1 Tax=Streptomyces sp. M41 TaxID=3059412 RepID=UPI00374D3E47